MGAAAHPVHPAAHPEETAAPPAPRPVVKRTARAIVLEFDPADPAVASLILIKRVRPGCGPYWVTPGGGVDPEDTTVMEALHREVDEELGGKVTDAVPAFVDTTPHPADAPHGDRHGVKVAHFFACRLEAMDPDRRHGPEVDDPQGTYEIVRLPFTRQGVTSVNVVPPALQTYLADNIEGIRALLSPDLG